MTDETIQRLIDLHQEKGLLPDLRGARVLVAGTTAPTLGKAQEIKRAWESYVRAANGMLIDRDYGLGLLALPIASSVRSGESFASRFLGGE